MGLLDNQTQYQYQESNNLGGYQFTSLNDIIENFMIVYTVNSIVKAYEFIEQGDENKLKLTKITADASAKTDLLIMITSLIFI